MKRRHVGQRMLNAISSSPVERICMGNVGGIHSDISSPSTQSDSLSDDDQRHSFIEGDGIVYRFTKVEEVQCGSHHCLCRLSDGTVYTWGKNQHGQVTRVAVTIGSALGIYIQGGVGNRATICPPAAVLGSRQRGPLREDVETNNSTVRREVNTGSKVITGS